MKKKSIATFLLAGVAACLMAGCANNKDPADKGITAADTALEATAEDAKKFLPEQYNDALGKLNALKIAFNKQKYDEVVAGIPAAQAAIKSLTEATAAKREEQNQAFAEEWKTISEPVQKELGEIEHQGELLEKAKKLPAGVDLNAARRYVAEAKTMWKQAQAAGESNQFEVAVSTAKKAQQRAQMAAKYMALKVPKT